MSSQVVKHVDQNADSNSSKLNANDNNDSSEYVVPHSNFSVDTFKNSTKTTSEMLGHLEKYIKEPLKEVLLLINLIVLDEKKEDNKILICEIKNFIKIALNNCTNIFKYKFDITKETITPIEKNNIISNEIWNGKLFIDISILVQKICGQKQINLSNEKAFICINEIYNYSKELSNKLDHRFVEWFIERFLSNDIYQSVR